MRLRAQLVVTLVIPERAWIGNFSDNDLVQHGSECLKEPPSIDTVMTLMRRAFVEPRRLEVAPESLQAAQCVLTLRYVMGSSGFELLGKLHLQQAPRHTVDQVLLALVAQREAAVETAASANLLDSGVDGQDFQQGCPKRRRLILLQAIDEAGDQILNSSQLRQELKAAQHTIQRLREELDGLRALNRRLSMAAHLSQPPAAAGSLGSTGQNSPARTAPGSRSSVTRSLINPNRSRRQHRGLVYKD